MDVPFRSSADLRQNICNATEDLGQYGTQKLPSGSTVYVVGNDSLYRLVKGVGDAYDDIAGLVINPNDGSNNRWFRETENGGDPWSAQVVLASSLVVTPAAQSTWIALGSTPGSFGLASGNNEAWSLNLATGSLSFRGPTRLVQVSYQVTLIGAAAIDVEAALNVSGDVPSGSTDAVPNFGNQGASVSTTVRACLSGQRQALVGKNDNVRLMLRNMTGIQNITALYAAYSVTL